MAEKKSEEETPAISTPDFVQKSDSGKDPAEFQTEEENPAAGEEEKPRESKRRRKCPAALDNFEEFETSNRNFSFSFATKNPSGGTPESTPKFGSFNLVGNLGLLGKINSTQFPEEVVEEEECDQISLGFTKYSKQEEEQQQEEQEETVVEEAEEQQPEAGIGNSIPIVVRTAD